jgi:exosortase
VVLITAVVTAIWAYWPTWLSLLDTWRSDPDYNHGFMVIPISLWLLWQRKELLTGISIRPSWWGLSLIVLAGIVRWLGAEFFFSQFEAWSIPLWIAGCVLLFGGWQLLRWSAGSIAFLWFMTPLPLTLTNIITLPLQQVSALLSTWTLHLFAQPAVRQGTTIVLGKHTLDVERACSGLRICYGTLAVAVAFAVLMRPRWPKVVLLIAASIPVAVVANSLRVTATGLLFQVVSGEKAHEYAHDFAGLLMLPLSLFLLWLVHWASDKIVAAFSKSSQAGGMLLLKAGVPLVVVSAGLAFWQVKQSDAALVSLLTMAEMHETEAARLDASDAPRDAIREWAAAARFLDHFCRLRPDDAGVAKRLAEAADHLLLSQSSIARARRLYARAWELDRANLELGIAVARLALAGDQFNEAISVSDEVFALLPPNDPRRLDLFRYKVIAMTKDASSAVPGRTSWTELSETLQTGLELEFDPVLCVMQLAVIYHQEPVDGIEIANAAVVVEELFQDLLRSRVDDPLAWLARYNYRQQFPPAAPAEESSVKAANADGQQEPVLLTPEELRILSNDADRDLDRAIELAGDSTDETLLPVWLAAGARELENDRFTEAIAFYESAKVSNPDHYRSYLQLAKLQTNLTYVGDEDDVVPASRRMQAIKILKEGLERDALSREYLLRVELFRQQWLCGDSGEAAEATAGAREMRSEFAEIIPEQRIPLELNLALVEAEVHAVAKHFGRAARVLETVLAQDLSMNGVDARGIFSRVWFTLGSYFQQDGQPLKAQESYEKALALAPDSVASKSFRAFEAENENQLGSAIELYREITERLGDHPGAQLGLARSLLRSASLVPQQFRRLSDVPQLLAQSRDAGAAVDEVAILEAEYWSLTGDNARAITVLQAATERKPKASRVWRRLAELQQTVGDAVAADAATKRYRELAGADIDAVLMEADILVARDEPGNAVDVLVAALKASADIEEKLLLLQKRVQIELNVEGVAEAQKIMEEFVERHAEDVEAQQALGEFYWEHDGLGAMVKVEETLKKLSGDDSPAWQQLRARRLLRLAAENPQDTSAHLTLLAQAKSLIDSFDVSPETNRSARILRGRVAMLEGRFPESVTHFQSAWEEQRKPISLGVELLLALNSAGETSGAQKLLTELQPFITVSPQLFDLALGFDAEAFSRQPQLVESLARGWAESIGDADSFLRLARVLSVPAVRSTASNHRQHMAEVESAYKRAIELEGKNPQIWGELLRFTFYEKRAVAETWQLLDELLQEPKMPELERAFAAARLLSEIGARPQASRFWYQAVSLSADPADPADPAVQTRVLLNAARFFTGSEPQTAVQLLHTALDVTPGDPDALRLLISILGTDGSLEEFRVASNAAEMLMAAGRPVTDTDRRVVAQFKFRRATAFADEFDAASDLREALALLGTLRQTSEMDAVLFAQVEGKMGDANAALQKLSEIARRTTASIASVAVFVNYWQDEFSDSGLFELQRNDAIEQLERTANSQLLALELRLRPESLTDEDRLRLVTGFLDRVVAEIAPEPEQERLLQATFEFLLRQGRQSLALECVALQSSAISQTRRLTAMTVAAFTFPGDNQFETQVTGLLMVASQDETNEKLDRSAADFFFLRANWPEAEKLYRRCLVRDAADIGVANNLAMVVAEHYEDFEAAYQLLSQAEAASQGDDMTYGYLQDTRAWLLLAEGKAGEAKSLLLTLSKSVAADTSVFLHLAVANAELGLADESKHAFDVARQMGITESLLPPMDRRAYQRLTQDSTATSIGLHHASTP